MKCSILIFVSALLLSFSALAQTDAINIIPSGNVGVGSTTPAQKLDVQGNIKLDDNMMVEGTTTYRVFRNLATYSAGSGAAGAFVINTNMPWNSAFMFRVKVEGYFYDATSPFETTIGAYMYTGNDFYNYGYVNVGANNLSVRLCRNATTNKVAIILGAEGSSYSYPKLTITSFMQGHSTPVEAHADGWAISQITALTGYDYVVSVPNVTTLPSGSGNYIQNQIASAQAANFWVNSTGRAAAFQLNDANTSLTETGGDALRIGTSSGYIDIGPQNTSWAHIQTDRPSFYFNPKITVDGNVEPYSTNTKDLGSNTLRWRDVYSYYHDVTPGDGYGIRFWESDSYKIHMGNVGENHYGPVTDYSIKNNMSNNVGRGWTWGVAGATPVAAIEATTGNMQIGGNFVQGPLIARPRATWSASGPSTGAVIIKLPGTTANYGMLHMEVDVYEYGSTAATTYILGGHNWSGQWYNYNCQTIGTSNKKVRLAVIGGQYAIVIGETGSTWSYGHVVLSKITTGGYYSGLMDLGGTYTAYQDNAASFTWITGDINSSTNPAIGTNYIQNQFSSAQSANYWINGNARIEGNTYIGSNANKYFYPSGDRINIFAESTSDVAEFASYGLYLPKTNAYNLYVGGGAQFAYGTAGYIDFKNEGGISTNGGILNMYFKNTGNVGIGTTAPVAKFHVSGGGQILGTNGTSSTTRTLTILEDGDAQLNFGAYPGSWTSAFQIQNNDNTDFIWMSPLQDGTNARIMTAGSGLDIYSDGSASAVGTFAGRFESNGAVGLLNLGSISNAGSTSDPSVNQGNNWITWGYRSDNSAYYCIRTDYHAYTNAVGSASTYSRLQLNWHTGIEIGASTSYGGTRFFNNSPGVGATQIMSVGDGDNNVRVNYALLVGSPSGTEAAYGGYWWRSRHDVDILDNDGNGTVASCNVGATGVVTNVNIYTELYHTYQGDLILDVYAPDGTSDRIWNRAGGSADNIIQWFNNRSVFNGKLAKGGWSLWMGDFAGSDDGYLRDWIVAVTTAAWSVGTGDVVASGRLVAGGNKVMGDMAEFFTSKDNLQAGQVVEIANNSDGDVALSSKEYGASVLGVVTTDPSLILNSSATGYPIALEGRVPVFVNDEGGMIKKGEYITSSSVTGVARKATHSGHCIGIAMEDQQHSYDKINVLLQRGWVDIGMQLEKHSRINDGGRINLENTTNARVQFKEKFTGINKDEIYVTLTAVNSPASLWVSDIDELGFTISAKGDELKKITVNWNATATRVIEQDYTVASEQDELKMKTVMNEMMAEATSNRKKSDVETDGPVLPFDLKPEFETKPETFEETMARYKRELESYKAKGGKDVAGFESDMNAKIAIIKAELGR